MRATGLSLIPVIIVLTASLAVFGDSSEEQKSIVEIERLGGKITRDDEFRGKPVNGVDFTGNRKLNDQHLHYLKAFKHLAALDLTMTQITDEGAEVLGEIESITALSLRGTRVTDVGIKELKGLKNLESLNLIGTQVTDAGVMELSSLEKLTSLYLSHSQKRGVDFKELREPGGLKNLNRLSNAKRPITDSGIKKLKESLPNLRVYR